MNCVDAAWEGLYDLGEGLPQGLEEKLSILMLCDPISPFSNTPVDGVGTRIDDRTFWVEQ
tara:strand:- start:70 stop:249 length:180 start_codon:yes stop_codon:yes gene_type:complete